jgi:hypothetical protein
MRFRRSPAVAALGLVVVACETPAYDEDGVTLIGTCGSSLGPWPDTSPAVAKAAQDLAVALGWQLAPTVRCPSCVQIARGCR